MLKLIPPSKMSPFLIWILRPEECSCCSTGSYFLSSRDISDTHPSPLNYHLFLIEAVGEGGPYHRGHQQRGRNAHWTGHQSAWGHIRSQLAAILSLLSAWSVSWTMWSAKGNAQVWEDDCAFHHLTTAKLNRLLWNRKNRKFYFQLFHWFDRKH